MLDIKELLKTNFVKVHRLKEIFREHYNKTKT